MILHPEPRNIPKPLQSWRTKATPKPHDNCGTSLFYFSNKRQCFPYICKFNGSMEPVLEFSDDDLPSFKTSASVHCRSNPVQNWTHSTIYQILSKTSKSSSRSFINYVAPDDPNYTIKKVNLPKKTVFFLPHFLAAFFNTSTPLLRISRVYCYKQ